MCAFCGEQHAAWVHDLDAQRAGYSIFGKGHTWSDRAEVCDRCEQLYRAGDDAGLIALQAQAWPPDVDDSHRKAVAAFRRADLGAVPIADWWPPGVTELVADGFTPLEDLTGNLDIATCWPVTHRRSVPETRPGWDDAGPEGQCWLVCSPWTSVPLPNVIRLLWRYVDEAMPEQRGYSGPVTAEMADRRNAAVAQFLSLDEAAVTAFDRAHPNPTGTETGT